MKDPYLYDNLNVLKNLANIKDSDLLHKAEADITHLTIIAVYNQKFDSFNTATLKEIHRMIFGQIYEWAGEFRRIQMTKPEDVLGGDTVRYAYPKEIKKNLTLTLKEIPKLKRTGENDHDIVFRLVRIIAQIWQIHPFREGNTRSIIVFAVLLSKSLGFDVDHKLLTINAAYVRNSLVWASQGIYSKHEYLERIFFAAILHESVEKKIAGIQKDYSQIEGYNTEEYQERPHEYTDKSKNKE